MLSYWYIMAGMLVNVEELVLVSIKTRTKTTLCVNAFVLEITTNKKKFP